MDFEEELLKRNIGFCVYANLNDRKGVHGYSGSHSGYDRSKDNPDVSSFHQRLNQLKQNPNLFLVSD